MNKATSTLLAKFLILSFVGPMTAAASNFTQKVAELWFGTDTQRIDFVKWVNVTQSCRTLSKARLYELLGHPETISERWGTESKSSTEALSISEAPDGSRSPPDQTTWVYQTLRWGSKESQEWSGEGSGYLLDLEIHFGSDGLALGCGTTQYTSGGDYNEMLEKAANDGGR